MVIDVFRSKKWYSIITVKILNQKIWKMGFTPPLSTSINEGIGNSQIKKRMNTLFLDKVLKELVRDTELDNLGLHLPFHYGSLYISSKKEISKLLTHKEYDYRESFYGYVMDLYSLTMERICLLLPKICRIIS